MISLVLPYWDRQQAADKALTLLAETYKGLDLEVIVVDDGNPVPFRVPNVGLNIRVITLPIKHEPKCPATVWNAGAKAAKGEVLVLSCIEILHETPVLEQMAEEVRKHKDNYVLASAWCPEEQVWHCHTSVTVPDCPPDAGIAFCAAMRPELFNRAGGFDEAYRDGAGYEDRDWIRRLHFVGAKFIKRDDLKVIHPKSGATISWGDGKFQRNLNLFRSKWQKSVTVVCLNAQNYLGLGSQYVNNLAEGVRKHMPAGVPWRFVCLTDDPTGLNDGIQVLPLPSDLKGWWGKLYLFKKGLFPDGQRIIFFDLDTIILGSLEKLTQYRGNMAILRDFYFPKRGAPGVILWKAGYASSIWDEWVAQGRPENPLGDLGWIENLDQGRFTKHIDRLQDLFPGDFASYKVHCKEAPPANTRVVCFHGNPRPHHYPSPWVRNVWKLKNEINKVQALIDDERYPEALALLNQKLDDDPNDLSSLFQFGEVLLKMDRIGLATNIYKHLSTQTNRSEVWNNLGRCYQKRETSKEARQCFKKALELDINSAAALVNLAVLDVNEGKPERAVILAEKALAIEPNSRQALDVISMGKLCMNQWEGWDAYLHAEGPPFRPLRQYTVPAEPEWMGEKGKTVVIYREQGLGDEIMFASCLQEVINDSKKVIVDCDKRLVGLFQRSFPEVDVYGTGHSREIDWPSQYQIDASAPFGRVPMFYRRSDESFSGKPYLKACQFRKKAYRSLLDSLGKGPKVGIAWTGGKRSDSVTRSDSDYRSLKLHDLEPLFREGHHYISLEYRPSDEIKESGLPIHDWSWITQSQDYDDTAALVDELDYIIAVPTTVVHLAGALGKPCYTLTPEYSNWRFGMGENMIWHASVKQFRGKDRVEKLSKFLDEQNKPLIQVSR